MSLDPPSPDARRRAAERNHRRLAALADGAPGLVVAAIAFEPKDASAATLDPASAAAVAELPGAVVWAWARAEASEHIADDLAKARAALGEATRVVLVLRPRARVLSAPLAGEVGAAMEGVDAVPLLRAVGALEEGELVRGVDLPWSAAAEARAADAGFVPRAPRD
jgi:hypothetical protein